MRYLFWKLTGWDFRLARRRERAWRRPAMWTEGGERIVDAGRLTLTVIPPWRRRARAMRDEQARWPAWRIQDAAGDPNAQASSSTGQVRAAKRASRIE